MTRSALSVLLGLALAGCCCGRCPPPCCAPCGAPPGPMIICDRTSHGPRPTAAAAPAATAPRRVAGDGWKGVVLLVDAENRESFDAQGTWVPTDEDLRRLEAGLPAALKASAPESTHPAADYVRQYLGVERDGKRKIEVRAMLASSLAETPEFWTYPLMVMDGEDGYFDATWDVASGRFDSIGIHGGA